MVHILGKYGERVFLISYGVQISNIMWKSESRTTKVFVSLTQKFHL